MFKDHKFLINGATAEELFNKKLVSRRLLANKMVHAKVSVTIEKNLVISLIEHAQKDAPLKRQFLDKT